MRRLLPILIALALLLSWRTTGLWAASLDAPLRHALTTADTTAEIPVIVTLNNQVKPGDFRHLAEGRQRRNAVIRALRQQSEESQRELRRFLKAGGVRQLKPLWIINGLAFPATPELIAALEARPEVAEIRLDGTIPAPAPVRRAAAVSEWNIDAVAAPPLWNLDVTGAGVVVASLDTGVDPLHLDLAGKFRGGPGDWFDPYNQHAAPYDFLGHGTAITGLMVGGDADGTNIGMAPNAQWIAAKIFSDADTATYAAIHQAFAWALDPNGDGDSIDAPQVVNNSWNLEGVNQCITEFQPDIALLQQTGIAVVFSAGNYGPNPTTSTSPPNYPESLAVGATDQTGAIASFSARGPSACTSADQLFPRLVAPGVGIKLADLTLLGAIPLSYWIADGTSFAAPHVSGLMALLLSGNAFPAPSLPLLEDTLEKAADDLGPLGPDNTFGYGLINGLAAYRRLAGQPHLAVYDSRPPENDRQLDFGSLPVGSTLVRTLTLRNSGAGFLDFGLINFSAPDPALSVTEDLCSGQSLAADQTCRITVSFAPLAAAAYNATLNISTNDPDFPVTAVNLNGSGNSNPTLPTLQVDPAGLTVEFGSVPPGTTSQRTLTLSNGGQELLLIDPIDISALAATPFALADDGCANASLAQNESCTVLFSFKPTALQIYQAQVIVTSNDPENSPLTVTLAGNGNHPPSAATLISPANGATGLETSLILRWLPSSDPDGDRITYQVWLSTEPQAGEAGAVGLPAAGITLLFLAGPVLYRRRRSRSPAPLLVILAAGLLFLASCSSGGGDPAPAAITYKTYPLTGLDPNTTYFWKVISTDSRGGVAESATWHFTTG
jgi:bacillopeptidase F